MTYFHNTKYCDEQKTQFCHFIGFINQMKTIPRMFRTSDNCYFTSWLFNSQNSTELVKSKSTAFYFISYVCSSYSQLQTWWQANRRVNINMLHLGVLYEFLKLSIGKPRVDISRSIFFTMIVSTLTNLIIFVTNWEFGKRSGKITSLIYIGFEHFTISYLLMT